MRSNCCAPAVLNTAGAHFLRELVTLPTGFPDVQNSMSNRREFLRQTALLGASPWLPEVTASAPFYAAPAEHGQSSRPAASTGAVILENPDMRLVIDRTGVAQSLIHKPTGQECLAVHRNVPMFTVTQYRPYDNELQLSYTAKPTQFPAEKISREGDQLIVSFALVGYDAVIRVKTTDAYISFQLERLDYRGYTSLRPKIKTPIDETVFVQLPVRNREHVGQWLNVLWDADVAVNLLATDHSTRVDAVPHEGYHLMSAGGVDAIQIDGIGAALITAKPDKLLDRIAAVEEDYDLPRGAESRRRQEYKYSYYEMLEGTPQTIDRHVGFAKMAGFRALDVYYRAFARTSGHFPWRPEYPNGIEDVKAVVQTISRAGMVPGVHIHYNKADKADAYITPRPDPRLNLTLDFTLGVALDASSSVVTILENPRRCTLDDGRRILKIENELIAYERFTKTAPYHFLNCQRGFLGSQPSSYAVGSRVGQLDVDTWPIFVRLTQNTDIQQEVAERLASLYKNAGFQFVYFDGAEDVPGPDYWYTVSRAQWIVYKSLDPKPLFGEGACKSHFSWHILTRGNAFDTFKPEVLKDAVRAYPAAEAPMAAKDFTSINFGWVGYWIPGKDTIGTQPDMLEYVSSRAAAWDCPVSLSPKLESLDSHARTADNLEVLRRWEDVRIQGWLTKQQKLSLRNLRQEHILLLDERGQFELVPYDEITKVAGADRPGRAFVFERPGGSVYVVFWHISGQAIISLPLPAKQIQYMKELGKPLRVQAEGKSARLPLSDRRYLRCTGITRAEVVSAFQEAKIEEIHPPQGQSRG
jgi:hypothetical protein